MSRQRRRKQSSQGSEPSTSFEVVSQNDIEFESKPKILGRGSFGDVELGVFRDECVAVKKMRDAEECLNEARRLAQLNHPHIVKFYAYFEDLNSLVFGLILELMHISLEKVIFDPNYKYFIDNIVIWAEQIASAIEAMHNKSLIHRDIKPNNILLNEDFTIVKLCDLGKTTSLQTIMTLGQGTIAFMAPEVFRTQHYNQKTDVYSFGHTLDTLVTRRLPYAEINWDNSENYIAPKGLNDIQIQYRKYKDEQLNRCPIVIGYCGGALKPIMRIINSCVKQKPHQRPNMTEIRKTISNIKEECYIHWRPVIDVKKNTVQNYRTLPAVSKQLPKSIEKFIDQKSFNFTIRAFCLSKTFQQRLKRFNGTYSTALVDKFRNKLNTMLKVIVIGWITWFQTQFCIEGVLIAYQSEWINESKIFTVNPKEAMRSFISWRFYSSMLGSLVYVALYKIHPVKLLRLTTCLFIAVGATYWLAFNFVLFDPMVMLIINEVFLGLAIAFSRSVSVICFVELVGYGSYMECLIIFGEVGECLTLIIGPGKNESDWVNGQIYILLLSIIPLAITFLPQFNEPFRPKFLLPSKNIWSTLNQIFNRNFCYRICLTAWIYCMSVVGINFWMFCIVEETTLKSRGITEKVWYVAVFCSDIVSIVMTTAFYAVEPWRSAVLCSSICSILYIFSTEVLVPLAKPYYIFVIISTVSISEASLAPLFANLHTLMRKSELCIGWPLSIFGYYAFNEVLRCLQAALPLWQILSVLVFLQIFFTLQIYLIFNSSWLSSFLVKRYIS